MNLCCIPCTVQKTIILALIAVIVPFCVAGGAEPSKKKAKKREICITFDELPAARGFGDIDRTAITYLTLQTLKRHKVKAAGFVVGESIEESYDILGEWLNEGHVLGNQTFTYQDFSQLDPGNFISDIAGGSNALETMLAGFGQKGRFFRYPFLHYGSNPDQRRAVQIYLEAHNIQPVHATVVIEDYLYNLSFEKMGKVPDSAEYEALMNDYLNHVIDEIERCERLSREILKRPCRQILQLRANRLNAVFLDEMLTALTEMGFRFVSLRHALKDELYRMPQAYFDSRGIGYLDMIKYSDPDKMPAH